MKKLEELRVVDLRAELDKRGLEKTGVKTILIERLKKSIQSEGGDPEAYEYIDSRTNSLNKLLQEDEQDSNDLSINCDSFQDSIESLSVEEGVSDSIGSNRKVSTKQEASLGSLKKDTQMDEKGRKEDIRKHFARDKNCNSACLEDKEDLPLLEEEEEDELRDLEEELMMEDEEDINEDGKEEVDGLTREEYAQHMEDDSINLMLEDDDKMLDYEENDRIDMEEISNADCKANKEDGTKDVGEVSSEVSMKLNSTLPRKLNKNESSKDHDDKERDELKGKPQIESNNSRNLWVSGLASNTRAQDLKSLFSKHGKVLSAKIVTNAKTPGAKCYGFVTMASVDDANKCISNLNRTELHGRMIQVEKAKGEPGGPKSTSTSKSGSSSVKDVDHYISEKNGDKNKDSVGKRDSLKKESDAKGKSSKDEQKDKSRSSTRERGRNSRGKSSSQSRLTRSSDREREKDRRSKDNDLRSKLSAKDRVVDRRNEIKRSGFSSSRNKNSPGRDMLSLHRIMEERERQRLRTRERLMREEERMRRDEEIHLRTLERRQKEEAERLHREREKLRLEREKLERQKQELLRLEREQQRMEREKLERERDELRKQQIKYEEVRRGVKRPAPPTERDRRDYYDDRKRGSSSRGPDRMAERSGSDRGQDRNIHRGPERSNLIRGTDRGGSERTADRAPERGPDHRGPRSAAPERGGGRFNDDDRDSRYDRHNDRVPVIRESSQYNDRRERDERRPADRSIPRSEGRDHRGPPLQSIRDRQSRESHYNGGSMSNITMDSWRTGGGTSHSSKNGPNYGSNGSGIMGGSVTTRGGVENQGNWRPSSSISTNERWGGNSSGIGGRSSIMDILRGADSYHISGGQVPMNPVPLMSGMSQGDRFGGGMSFRK